MNYLYLTIAIVSEVIGTSALKALEGFSKLTPSILVVIGYGTAFYFLSLTLKTIPVGIAYAMWLDLAGWIGIFLIATGVVVLNVLSKTSAH